jgi:hypothetical protein
MAKKSMKNLAKIAAGLGAAYALSKMGKGTMDGTEGDFPASSTPEVKGRMQPTSRGTMDGTEGEISSFRKTKKRKR